ncbi:hypothetical protein GGF31_004821 [Allomyces arbusculus]|nr:hypothetical protein GGF31_004821 [Allomyces arbusculus]
MARKKTGTKTKSTSPTTVQDVAERPDSAVSAPVVEEDPFAPPVKTDRGDLNRYLNEQIPDNVLAGMSFWMHEYQAFLTGIMFFTRLPCPMWVDHNLYWISQSTVYFPLIGVIVGLFGTIAYKFAAFLWHPTIGVLFSTLATVWLTGAFHEDGVADCFDAFGGGWGKTEILRIMRDSRLGTYGCIGLVLVLGAKLSGLNLLLGGLTPVTTPVMVLPPMVLVAGHVMGRWACVYLLYAHPYMDDAAQSAPGKHFVLYVTPIRLVVGTVTAFAFTAWALQGSVYHLALVWVLGTLTTIAAGRYIVSILDGVIGDSLGAANQIVEVVTYLALAVRPLDVVAAELAAVVGL